MYIFSLVIAGLSFSAFGPVVSGLLNVGRDNISSVPFLRVLLFFEFLFRFYICFATLRLAEWAFVDGLRREQLRQMQGGWF